MKFPTHSQTRTHFAFILIEKYVPFYTLYKAQSSPSLRYNHNVCYNEILDSRYCAGVFTASIWYVFNLWNSFNVSFSLVK